VINTERTTTINKRNKTIKQPILSKQELEKGLPDDTLQEHAYYSKLALSLDNFTEQEGHHLNFDQILFQNVLLSKTDLKKVQVLDSRFVACDLANAKWSEATFSRVELLGCHLTGFQCGEALLQDVLFKECRASFAQFALTKFKSVRFEDCDLSEANFFEADLSGVTFLNCNLQQGDFARAKLVGADLRGSKIDGMRVGPSELKGATIDPTQAVAFVRGLGITVDTM
jgi:uncharacterized protein YjbI with pentapeptide repeats